MEIENNIQIPDRAVEWPFTKMEVGQSVLFIEQAKKAQTYAHVFGRQKGWKFTTRAVDGGIRIWRVA